MSLVYNTMRVSQSNSSTAAFAHYVRRVLHNITMVKLTTVLNTGRKLKTESYFVLQL